MKVEVDIDMNKINYDKIQEAVLKKVDECDIAALLESDYYGHQNLHAVIDARLNRAIEAFLTKSTNSSAEKSIEDKVKDAMVAQINDACKKVVDDAVSRIGEDTLLQIAEERMPYIFISAMFDRMKNVVIGYEATSVQNTIEVSTEIAKNNIRQAFYESGHNVPSI